MKKYVRIIVLLCLCCLFFTACSESSASYDTTSSAVSEIVEVSQETAEVNEAEELTNETSEEESIYTYIDLDQIMYATASVNVRSLPTKEGEKVGSLSPEQEVKVTGQCNETNWYRIEYNSNSAYVSNNYLTLSEKNAETATQTVTETSVPTQEPTPVPTVAPTPEPTPEPQQESASSPSVWISETGSKYHSINNCGRMNPNKATQMSKEKAQSLGYEQCSKCW